MQFNSLKQFILQTTNFAIIWTFLPAMTSSINLSRCLQFSNLHRQLTISRISPTFNTNVPHTVTHARINRMIIAGNRKRDVIWYSTPPIHQSWQICCPRCAQIITGSTVQFKVQTNWICVILAFYGNFTTLIENATFGKGLGDYFVFLQFHWFFYFTVKFSAKKWNSFNSLLDMPL